MPAALGKGNTSKSSVTATGTVVQPVSLLINVAVIVVVPVAEREAAGISNDPAPLAIVTSAVRFNAVFAPLRS